MDNQKSASHFLIDQLPDPAVIVGPKGKFLAVNDKVKEKTGFSKEELIGHNFLNSNIVPIKSKIVLIKNLTRRMKGSHIAPYEIDVNTRFDHKLRCELNAIKIQDGNQSAVMVVFRDITKRSFQAEKIAEEKIKDSKERYRKLFDGSRDAIIITQPNGNIIELNQSALELFKYSKDEIFNLKTVQLYSSPLERKKYQKQIEKHGYVKDHLAKFKTKNSEELECIMTSTAQYDSDGNTYEYQTIIRDITDKKKAEKALLESEQKYRVISENTDDLIAVIKFSLKPTYTYVSPSHKKTMGWDPKDLIGKSGFDFVHPDDKRKLFSLLKEAIMLKGKGLLSKNIPKKSQTVEYRAIDKNGNYHNLESTVNVVKDEILLVSRDVTERKRMQEKLKSYSTTLENSLKETTGNLEESIQQFQNLFNLIPDPAVIVDSKGRFIAMNDKSLDRTGYKREDLLGKSFLTTDLVNQKFKLIILENLGKRLLGKKIDPYEIEIVSKDRKEKGWAEVNAKKMNYRGKNVALVILREITIRKHSEIKLRESTERYQTLFDLIPDPVFVTDNKGKFLEINEAAEIKYGLKKETIIGKNVMRLKGLTRRSKAKITYKSIKRSIIGSKAPYEIESKLPNGKTIFGEINAASIILNDKSVNLSIVRDITAKKEAEIAKRKTEEMYKLLVNTAPDSVIITDPNGLIVEANEQTKKLFTFEDQSQIIGKSILQLVSKKEENKLRNLIIETQNTTSISNIEIEMERNNGDKFIGEINFSIIDLENNEKSIIFLTRDITERQKIIKMKEQFISAATHELRTPLVSIKGYSDYILSGKSGEISKSIKNNLAVVKRNTDLLMRLTDDLLDVRRIQAGKLKLKMEDVNLNNLLSDCLDEMTPIIEEKDHCLETNIPNKNITMIGDPIRIKQVILNILTNAAKFTQNSGKISVSVEESKEEIMIIIKDNGMGIRKEDIDRIFEPFANIEKSSYVKGTGLGLSVAQGLIKLHNGAIIAHSEGTNKGTTFTILLPKMKVMEIVR